MQRRDRAMSSSEQRATGRQQVIQSIRRAEQIARIDIAADTGFSPATVTAITAELAKHGLIQEVAPTAPSGDQRRGRPRVDLCIRGDAHLIAGLKISNRVVSVTFIDFVGKTIGQYDHPMTIHKLSGAELALLVRETLDIATAKIGKTIADLSGVGVGVAGLIDAPNGFVHWSPSMTERNFDLHSAIVAEINIPVFIENDANLVAKAEQMFGYGRGLRNFIVVTIEHGVGMGIVIDGKIYRGTRGCGAEFGHSKVHLDGALCRCGQRGCLEAYVADYALLREASISGSLSRTAPDDEQLDQLFRDAKSGDDTAQSIFRRAGKMFAMGLANIVNVFDPELIILAGERMQLDYLYDDDVINMVRRSVVQIDAPLPNIRIHKWGDMMWAKGAAALAMEGVTDLAIKAIADDA